VAEVSFLLAISHQPSGKSHPKEQRNPVIPNPLRERNLLFAGSTNAAVESRPPKAKAARNGKGAGLAES
jgi:hypothetical protein